MVLRLPFLVELESGNVEREGKRENQKGKPEHLEKNLSEQKKCAFACTEITVAEVIGVKK